MIVQGTIVDVVNRRIFDGSIHIANGKIEKIVEENIESSAGFIIPGFIDAHVHIESTMVTPYYFAEHVKKFGTLGVITDPHEISNVCGVDGFDYMYNEAKQADIGIYFGIPSCVPATPFETSGAVFDPATIDKLFAKYDVVGLSEMMNFPGVVNSFPDVVQKLEVAKKHKKPIDGHAPGLRGDDLLKYIKAGIATDHEAFSYEEAKEKIECGMKIQIREGSAARNFDVLSPLIDEYPNMVMLCTDDSHPDTLQNGHIDRIVKLGIEKGLDILNILQAASINAINHYNLPIGKLQEGDSADFLVVDDLGNFNVQQSWLKGVKIYKKGEQPKLSTPFNEINVFNLKPVSEKQIQVPDKGTKVKIIEAIDGELITNSIKGVLPSECGFLKSDVENDVLKMVVVNRYSGNGETQVGFVKGFGIKKGAFASSVAHDSHNIIAVGTNDADILKAINGLVESKGGICVCYDSNIETLPLPVGGLMANEPVDKLAVKYSHLDQKVKQLGSTFKAPFMTLAFISLLVIPSLKLGDKGLFDVTNFEFTNLYV